MAKVTDEIWTLDTDTRVGSDGQICVPQYGIRRWAQNGTGGNLPDHGLSAFTSDTLLFVGHGGDRHHSGEGLERVRLASMAPIMFRMLVRAVESGKLPPDLEAGIRANLHLASPITHPSSPPHEDPPRRSGWEHLILNTEDSGYD